MLLCRKWIIEELDKCWYEREWATGDRCSQSPSYMLGPKEQRERILLLAANVYIQFRESCQKTLADLTIYSDLQYSSFIYSRSLTSNCSPAARCLASLHQLPSRTYRIASSSIAPRPYNSEGWSGVTPWTYPSLRLNHLTHAHRVEWLRASESYWSQTRIGIRSP